MEMLSRTIYICCKFIQAGCHLGSVYFSCTCSREIIRDIARDIIIIRQQLQSPDILTSRWCDAHGSLCPLDCIYQPHTATVAAACTCHKPKRDSEHTLYFNTIFFSDFHFFLHPFGVTNLYPPRNFSRGKCVSTSPLRISKLAQMVRTNIKSIGPCDSTSGFNHD